MPNFVPKRPWNAQHPEADLDNAEVHLRLWFKEMGYDGKVSIGKRGNYPDYFDFDVDKPYGVFLVMKDKVGTINDNYGAMEQLGLDNVVEE